MEGILWKWTNYWNGWQTRWFMLENGALTYYKSKEEASQGCKGSIRVQACQINVHPIDSTRMDLVIPGEQHLYLRAATSQERQKWLVALGSTKACVQNGQDVQVPDLLKCKKNELRIYCDLLMQQAHDVKTTVIQCNGINDAEKMYENTRLISDTCDMFIKTLEECMKLSHTPSELVLREEEVILPPLQHCGPTSTNNGVQLTGGGGTYRKASTNRVL